MVRVNGIEHIEVCLEDTGEVVGLVELTLQMKKILLEREIYISGYRLYKKRKGYYRFNDDGNVYR